MICEYYGKKCLYTPVALSVSCDNCVVKSAYKNGVIKGREDVDDCEMYIPVPDVSSTIRILEIEKQCVLRQDTPDCNRDECGCQCCDLVQNADEVISAYDTAINMLKQVVGND